MLRLRMSLVETRSQGKNRIHAALLRHNVILKAQDIYGVGGRQELASRLTELPEWTRQSVVKQLETVDWLQMQIQDCEQSLETLLEPNAERDLLRTLPGVGKILSGVIALEVGEVSRFGGPERLTSYCGLVPAARESAGKKRKGKCPADCNGYLRWAFIEAANVVAIHRHKWPERHVAQLYERVKHSSKLHGKATGGGGSPSGRGFVLDVDQARNVSRAELASASSFVDARVSAAAPWPWRLICECDTRQRNRIMPKLRAYCMVLTNEQIGSISTTR